MNRFISSLMSSVASRVASLVGGRAATLAARAGHAAGAANLSGGAARGRGASRRGTFLVLVVGTLALLSVIAIVYVTIGSQDTRVVAATVRQEKIEDVPQRVADYLADVIARDRLAVRVDPADGQVFLRETSDYPATDMFVRSDVAIAGPADPLQPFSPEGSWTSAAQGVTRASDPYLASATPSWIGVAGDDPSTLLDPTDVTRLYRDNRDWRHISNFAPNGRFVNLWNLRNNFGAGPGVAAGDMSANLSLFDADGQPTNVTIFGAAADPQVPAVWTMDQRFAARPAASNPYLGAADPTENPGSPFFKLYQWADADGDGILDARWFELVDDRGVAGGLATLLGNTGDTRYFVAARAIDLSGRVNVNTATNFDAPISTVAPAGATPSDIDLRRLLSLRDAYDLNAPINGDDLLGGYDGLRNPTDAQDPQHRLAANYAPSASPGPRFESPPSDSSRGYNRARAEKVGEYAYASLRLSVIAGTPLSGEFYGTPLLGDEILADGPARLAIEPDEVLWNLDSAERRRNFYERIGSTTQSVADASPDDWRNILRFAEADLVELLTYNSVNDPDVTSALEVVVGGKDNTDPSNPGSARYSPLRSNRPLRLELAAVPSRPGVAGEGLDEARAPFDGAGAADVEDGLEAFETRYLLHQNVDIRQSLTTLSGAVPLRTVRAVSANELGANELPVDVGAILDPSYNIASLAAGGGGPETALPTFALDAPEVKAIFRGYADALIPYSSLESGGTTAWETAHDAASTLRTLSYGYRGPQTGLYAAAFMTANFVDMVDRERERLDDGDASPAARVNDYERNVPTALTLVVDSGAVVTNTDPLNPSFLGGLDPAFDGVLNLDDLEQTGLTRLADAGDPVLADAVNVFGVEAQPFVTRVSVFTHYADSDTRDGSPIVIDTSMSEGNDEFLFRAVAWQLTNPFNVPIVLWESAADADLDAPASRYFIEFDGRTYLVRPLTTTGAVFPPGATTPPAEGRIVIYPRRSIAVYTLSQTPTAIATRLSVQRGSPVSAEDVLELVERPLRDPRRSTSDIEPGDAGHLPATYAPDLNKVQHAYYIGNIDLAEGRARATQPVAQVFSTLVTSDAPETRLWRRVRDNGRLPVGSGSAALIEYDMLVDRLRVPQPDPGLPIDPDTVPILNRRFGDPTRDTSAQLLTVAGVRDDEVEDDGWRNPPITLWASVRRPSNPGTPPLGALPAYCLEPKGASRWNVFNNDRLDIGSGGSWNPATQQMPRGTVTWSLDESMFRPGSGRTGYLGATRAFSVWFSDFTNPAVVLNAGTQVSVTSPTADNAPPTLDRPAFSWSPTPTLAPTAAAANHAVGVAAWRRNPLIPQTASYAQWYPEVALNNGWFTAPVLPGDDGTPRVRSVRVADMLLPLAVGSMMNPAFAETALEQRWTTLGESMAIAMGYQRPTTTVAATAETTLPVGDVARLLDPAAVATGSTGRANYTGRLLFDRGQVRLDEFVPFVDEDTDGVFDYLSEGATATERRAFTQVPLALNVLDQFVVGTRGLTSSGFAAFVGLATQRDAADLTRPVPGLVNVNTATEAVLRTLPMVSPFDPATVDEVQTITIPLAATGPVVLSFQGNSGTTALDAVDAGAAIIAHLQSIAALAPANVVLVSEVTGTASRVVTVRFTGALAGTDVTPIGVTTQPSGGSIAVATVTEGVPPVGPVWWGGATGLDATTDLVAALVSARDKSRVFLRPSSSVFDARVAGLGLDPDAAREVLDPTAPGGTTSEVVSFFDRDPSTSDPVGSRDLHWPTGLAAGQLADWAALREGRRQRTEINGIGEDAGFGSLGALQTVVVRDGDPTTPRTGPTDLGGLPLGMDFLAHRTTATAASIVNPNGRARVESSRSGLTSTVYAARFVNGADPDDDYRTLLDSIPGDFKEQLIPVAAMSNIATTRSDYFAVWFVVHGYTEGDVTGLAAADALVPSVARRFLMIVDRSNVTRLGQRPRVVVFREVPYSAQ
jgi:hypothetical protein